MNFAYADPPYLGRADFYRDHHPEAMIWDDPETHRALIVRLQDEFPDGWVMSLAGDTLRVILPMCPPAARVGTWITERPRFAGNTSAPVAIHPETGERVGNPLSLEAAAAIEALEKKQRAAAEVADQMAAQWTEISETHHANDPEHKVVSFKQLCHEKHLTAKAIAEQIRRLSREGADEPTRPSTPVAQGGSDGRE